MAEKEYIERAETCEDCLYSVMCDLCADGEICGHFKSNADVVEVRHGEWKQTTEPLGAHDVECVECSICGESWVLDEDFDYDVVKDFWNYCPNCGAKMDGGKPNERT